MNITELMVDLVSHFNAIIRNIASNHNLTAPQAFHIFLIPYDGISMSLLAHKLGIDTSTITRNIQKLEMQNIVFRNNDNYDKRISNVYLTKKGRDVLGSLEQTLQEKHNLILDKIDIDTQEHIVSVLELRWNCIRI